MSHNHPMAGDGTLRLPGAARYENGAGALALERVHAVPRDPVISVNHADLDAAAEWLAAFNNQHMPDDGAVTADLCRGVFLAELQRVVTMLVRHPQGKNFDRAFPQFWDRVDEARKAGGR